MTDLNNPPHAIVLHTASSNDIIGYPSGLGGNVCTVIQCIPGGGDASNYSAQIAFSFGSDKIAVRRKYSTTTWTNWKYFASMEPLKSWQPKNVKSYDTNRCWYIKNGNLLTVSFRVETFAYVEGEPRVVIENNVKNAFGVASTYDAFTTCFYINGGALIVGVSGTQLYIQTLGDVKWEDGASIYGQISTYFT